MKQYSTRFIIGACLTASAIMFMGACEFESDGVGRYQISIAAKDRNKTIFETIIDTKTGKVVSRNRYDYSKYYKKHN